MFRLALVAALFTVTPALASTWPDEDWAYGAQRVATAEDMAAFKTAKKCGRADTEGSAVYIIGAPNFAVFKVTKDGIVYRLFNADAERYGIDFCDPSHT
jgi:hypothetical protein